MALAIFSFITVINFYDNGKWSLIHAGAREKHSCQNFNTVLVSSVGLLGMPYLEFIVHPPYTLCLSHVLGLAWIVIN